MPKFERKFSKKGATIEYEKLRYSRTYNIDAPRKRQLNKKTQFSFKC